MENPLIFIIIFAGIWCFMGIIFLTIGLAMRNNTNKKQINCTSKTVAKVTDLVRNTMNSMDGNYSTSWHPVIEYTVGDLKYIKESPYGSAKSRYAIGQELEICYNPEDPHEYYICGDKLPKTASTIFTIVGIVGITVAFISAVVYAVII